MLDAGGEVIGDCAIFVSVVPSFFLKWGMFPLLSQLLSLHNERNLVFFHQDFGIFKIRVAYFKRINEL